VIDTYEYRPGPSRYRSRQDYSHLAEHLKVNPGVWVKVRTATNSNSAASAAYQIRVGRRAAFRPAGQFDAYSEGADVIARYTGTQGVDSDIAP
jgi:hypothetical protein